MRRLESFFNVYQEAMMLVFFAAVIAAFTFAASRAGFPYTKPVGAGLAAVCAILAWADIPQERARKYLLLGLTAETLIILFAR